MRVLLFGATGMVGQGVLRACLDDAGVTAVLAVGRRSLGLQHAKLRELVRADLADLAPVAEQLAGYDACFLCLGASSLGLSAPAYRRVTFELTLAVARALLPHAPRMALVYVSGQGTDAGSRMMWARVKGETEAALQALPFRRTVMFRPGLVQPRRGARPRSAWGRAAHALLAPAAPLLARALPHHVTDTEQLGVAMIAAVRHHEAVPAVLENRDINWMAAI